MVQRYSNIKYEMYTCQIKRENTDPQTHLQPKFLSQGTQCAEQFHAAPSSGQWKGWGIGVPFWCFFFSLQREENGFMNWLNKGITAATWSGTICLTQLAVKQILKYFFWIAWNISSTVKEIHRQVSKGVSHYESIKWHDCQLCFLDKKDCPLQYRWKATPTWPMLTTYSEGHCLLCCWKYALSGHNGSAWTPKP